MMWQQTLRKRLSKLPSLERRGYLHRGVDSFVNKSLIGGAALILFSITLYIEGPSLYAMTYEDHAAKVHELVCRVSLSEPCIEKLPPNSVVTHRDCIRHLTELAETTQKNPQRPVDAKDSEACLLALKAVTGCTAELFEAMLSGVCATKKLSTLPIQKPSHPTAADRALD